MGSEMCIRDRAEAVRGDGVAPACMPTPAEIAEAESCEGEGRALEQYNGIGPPAEHTVFGHTDKESDLAAWCAGPDPTWRLDADPPPVGGTAAAS